MADESPQGQDPGAGAEPADAQKSPEELRSEIADTREDLGETVEQLAAKADVKTRAHEAVQGAKGRAHAKVEDGRDQVRQAADRVQAAAQQKRAEGVHTEDVRGAAQAGAQKARKNPAVLLAVGVGAALLVLLVLRRRSG